MTTDEQKRIKSYLQAQGAKLSPEQIIEKVSAAMADLTTAADTVPSERFAERPGPEDWSGNEVMAHVVDSGRSFGDRIVNVLDGAPVVSPPRHGGREAAPSRSAREWSAELARDRAALFERVRRADPGSRPEAVIEHPFFGMLTWRESLLFLRLHDLDHAGQLQKIAAALGGRPAA
jgi:hypothetical protein